MVERTLSKKRYFLAFVLTTGVFLLGLLLGAFLTEKKFTELKDLQQELRTQLASYEIQSVLVSQDPCAFKDVDSIVDELGSLANRLTAMEDQRGRHDKEVLSLKEYYSLLEIRHWLFLKKLNEQCNANYTLILYFYSDDKSCPSCGNQGFILSYLRTKYPETVRVYSFDLAINNPALSALKSFYTIREAPTIVIQDTPYPRYLSKEELESRLHENDSVNYLPK
ncbi:MAG TPA: hypothetical protein VFE88_04680 [Candidatus Nanoarchaeia archaeon]|nr:hypothetical protein [Candidatus Nanoarchaeia archaeon]